jgi:hypothetical protein
MGFLDNSGDIILDAVLTDLGRKRLAEGNGRFRVSKFALGDDEIDYGLYDKDAEGGTPYFDINILQTPVLEAFTNNMSSMKSRLMSYSANDLLFLPVIAIRNAGESALYSGFSNYVVLVDEETTNALTTDNNSLDAGLFNGYRPDLGTNLLRTDQGINSLQLSQDSAIDPVLLETQYFVQIDNRLGFIRPQSNAGASAGSVSFQPVSIDNDNIATYIFTLGGGASGTISKIPTGAASAIDGPRGTRLAVKVAASLNLRTSTFLFTQLGTQGTSNITSGAKTLLAANYKFIDSTVRVSGVSTGYTLDVPVRFVKKTS